MAQGGRNVKYDPDVHKVSFSFVPQLVNHLLRDVTACA